MSLSNRIQRPLDHIVLPVTNLTSVRLRLSKLGFFIAPDAVHPFGTANSCVFFADSTYLEPLAIVDPELYKIAVQSANEFIRRDNAYRFRVSENGLSALVFKSIDAMADHTKFVDLGISAGDILCFSRPYEHDDGSVGVADFKLAFSADLRSPDLFFFTCERLMPLTTPAALLSHQNGVTGISEIIIGEDNPMDFEPLIVALSNSHGIDIHPYGIIVRGHTAQISVFTHDHLLQEFNLERQISQRGLQPRAIVFQTVNLATTSQILKQNAIPFETVSGLIKVAPAPGQGVTFIFKEE